MNNKRYEKLLRDYESHSKRIRMSTAVDIQETPTQKRKRKEKLEKHYGKWFEYYLEPYAKSKCSRFQIALANLIIKNPVLYVIVNWYRGAAKTVHTSLGIPLYLMLVKKDMKFMLLVGENEKKAKLLISAIQIALRDNQKIIHDYGEQFSFGDWSEGDFSTRNGVHFMALGLGQSPRGVRYEADRPDYIVCSDVDTKKRSKNPSLVREMVDWIMEDLWGCFDSEDNSRERFILDNNRISKTSIVHLLTESFKTSIQESKQKELPIVHHISRVIAHDKDFNPSWPEKTTKEYWKKKYASRPKRSYHREYLDDPIIEGKIFKLEWLQYKRLERIDTYDALCIYGDMSYKDEGCYKAMKFWGKKGREKHLLDCYVRQGSRRLAAIWLYNLFEDLKNIDNHLNIRVMIEGLFAQDEFVNDFDEEGDRRNWHIPVLPDERSKTGKHDRIESMSGHYEKRWIWYNEKKKGLPDFEEAVAQLLAFEKGSSYPVDSPDADHGSWRELNRMTFIEDFDERIGDEIEMEERF